MTGMKKNKKRIIQLVTSFWVLKTLGGCSTTELIPPEVPSPPVYTQVPHPEGMDLGDLTRVLSDGKAPQDPEFSKNCDQRFLKIKKLVKSKEELDEAVLELITEDPVHYHWCFYSKLNGIENDIRSDKYLDEKQKLLIEGYEFLVPAAKAFQREFKDSRYLRWAVFRYKKNSEVVFFRKLDLTPAGTAQLVQPINPFGLWRKDTPPEVSVLEKYHIQRDPNSVNPGPSVQPVVPTAPLALDESIGIAPASPTPGVSNMPSIQPSPIVNLTPLMSLPPEISSPVPAPAPVSIPVPLPSLSAPEPELTAPVQIPIPQN
jgi:hypothetical protein